jgi:hypothetical protein
MTATTDIIRRDRIKRTRLVRTYRMLVRFGHAPDKALEITIDAKRGDSFARHWIGTVFSQRHG